MTSNTKQLCLNASQAAQRAVSDQYAAKGFFAKAAAAFAQLGIPYPPMSWASAWDDIRDIAVNAFDALREEVHGARQP